jgi:L-serine/L-threonine ammonia-lyase
MVAKLEALGAQVRVRGAMWKEADAYMRESLMDSPSGSDANTTKIYVPPFDHPDIWEGAESLVYELEKQMAPHGGYDGLVCSVGGGGLLVGVVQGLDMLGRSHDVQVLALETAGAHSLASSLAAGENTTLPAITSIANSLGCVRVAEKAFEAGQKENVHVAVLSDAAAAMGCVHLADLERLLVEVACGINVAVCFDGTLRRALGAGLSDAEWADRKIVLEICGGSNVSPAIIEEYRARYAGEVEREIARQEDRVVRKLVRGVEVEGLHGGGRKRSADDSGFASAEEGESPGKVVVRESVRSLGVDVVA